ncbi:MAG: hypothetical protein JSU70_19620 [Phycisphaerales bacterium]|nr:MAG: hypothetical protein JSU70_19620 [Phycisphaerales bacterium]
MIIGAKLGMIRKVVFLIVFTPIHTFVTILMVQRFFYNPSRNAGVMEAVCKIITFVFTLPVLFPYMLIDPDGERSARWFQGFLLFFNAFVWALLLLLLFYIVKRLRARRVKPG